MTRTAPNRPVYTEIFDGLRGYYARYANRRSAAGFNAAMTLSLICCVAVSAGFTLLDYLVTGNVDRAVYLFQNKPALILCGVAIAYAHVQFGKHTGRYHSVDLSEPPKWKSYLVIYSGISTVLLIAAIVVALLGRHGIS